MESEYEDYVSPGYVHCLNQSTLEGYWTGNVIFVESLVKSVQVVEKTKYVVSLFQHSQSVQTNTDNNTDVTNDMGEKKCELSGPPGSKYKTVF